MPWQSSRNAKPLYCDFTVRHALSAFELISDFLRRILWAFHIEPETDADGNPVYPDPNASTSNVTRRPQQFACALRPRSKDIADIIHEEAQRAEETLKEWEQ